MDPDDDMDPDDIDEGDIGAAELITELAAEPAAEVADVAVEAVDPQAARVRARPAPATRARARFMDMMSPWDLADPDLRFRRGWRSAGGGPPMTGESLSSSTFR
jgi:hypothetical protein